MGELVLAGTAALITGGGSGIGLAAAATCCATARRSRSPGAARSASTRPSPSCRPRRPTGAEVRGVACDVAEEDDVAARRRGRHRDHRRPPALRGVGGHRHRRARSSRCPASEWHRVIDINLHGAFFTLKHAGAAMVRAGRRRVRRACRRSPGRSPIRSCPPTACRRRGSRRCAQRRRRARPRQRPGQRRPPEHRAHRAGRAPRAGPGGAGRLPRQHADRPHRHRRRHRPPHPVPLRPRVVVDHRPVHQRSTAATPSGGARTSSTGPGPSTATTPSTDPHPPDQGIAPTGCHSR